MREFDELPCVRGMLVDVDALCSIEHECRPTLCADTGVCCAGYDICVEEQELDRLTGATALAADYVPGLAEGPPPFRHLFADLYALDTDEAGLCVYAWRDPAGRTLCSLHSAALDRGLDVRRVKPRSCLLWPLAVSGSEPGYLSVDPGAFRYPCNRRRPASAAGLHRTIRRHVAYVFGEGFLEELEAVMDAGR